MKPTKKPFGQIKAHGIFSEFYGNYQQQRNKIAQFYSNFKDQVLKTDFVSEIQTDTYSFARQCPVADQLKPVYKVGAKKQFKV